MGFLKKIFKPVSKVLDKIIPNEIKPALPYLAAFAPVFGPTAGMFGSTMGRRALTSGLLNIGGQLAQEGNEGDINLLSAGLGALSGAMTTPGAADKFASMKTPTGTFKDFATDTVIKRPELSLLDQAKNFGLEGLSKGSELLRPGGEIPNLFSKAGLKAATLPATTATGDVMQAEARRLEKQSIIDAALDEAAALGDTAASALAIRNAMEAYGFFSEDEILSTIESAGYADGGRVGFFAGGLGALGGAMEKESEYITKKSDTSETDTINRIYEEQGSDGLNAFLERNPDLKDKYVIVTDAMSGELTVMPNKLHPDNMEGTVIMLPEMKAKGGRVGFKFGGIDEAVESVQEETVEKGKEGIMTAAKEDPMLVEEYNKYVFDLMEQRPNAKPMSFSDFKRMIMSGMKDGGIMKAKRGLVNEPGGYAGEMAGPLRNKIEGFNKKMVDEFLQGNFPEFQGEFVSDYYNRPNFTDVSAVLKIIEMGGDFDDVRETLNIDISDERIKDFIRFDQEDRAREEGSMKDGGLMDLGGKEMDLRGGGFVPIGKKEKADDVPARLSKNEFVMTADAVRAAGGGSVNEGAKRMYDVMNKLEARA